MSTLRKYLIAGLLVWLPLAATVFVIGLLIDLLDRTQLLLPPEYRLEKLIGYSIPGSGVILAIIVLLITGVLAANLFGRRAVALWEKILNRIPLVRTVYNSVKQISVTVLASDSKAFRRVVLVEYPRLNAWSMGFLTRDNITIDSERLNGDLAAVFVPTTPNPTSGYIVMLPRQDIVELDISVEDGFKYIISMGVIAPDSAIKGHAVSGRLARSTHDP
jgi:uncharacterized membrane protein